MTLSPLSPEPSGFANPCGEIALSNFESCGELYADLQRIWRMYSNIIEQAVTDGRGYDPNSDFTNKRYVGFHQKLLNMDYRDGKIAYSEFEDESINLISIVNTEDINNVDALHSAIFQIKMNKMKNNPSRPFYSIGMYSGFDATSCEPISFSYSRPAR